MFDLKIMLTAINLLYAQQSQENFRKRENLLQGTSHQARMEKIDSSLKQITDYRLQIVDNLVTKIETLPDDKSAIREELLARLK